MKRENRAKLDARATRALRDLYHNATSSYPREMYGRDDNGDTFQAWFEDVAEQALDYIQSGGAYGRDYRATLAAPCNAGRYKSAAAQARYILKGLQDQAEERRDCGMLTGWRIMEIAADNRALGKIIKAYRARAPGAPLTRNDSLWERITEYGELHQYGRGGRTLAPKDLIQDRGGSGFRVKGDYAAELPPAAVVELIQIVESFNRYVMAWCASAPEMWREHCAEEDADKAAAKRARAVRKAKETRERNYWAARDIITL